MANRRRRFLRLCGAAGIGVLAGCASSSDGTETSATETTQPNGGTPTSERPTESTTDEGVTQHAKLVATDGKSDDEFGRSVAVSGDGTTALLGAPGDNDADGAVYVFEATEGSWRQQTKLTGVEDGFGASVALSSDGTTAIVTPVDVGGYDYADVAYVFEASDEGWSQQAQLTASDGDSEDRFGSSIAISDDGTTAVVGATRADNENGSDAGMVYVFAASDEGWSQQQKLAADDGTIGDLFGSSVALSSNGTTAAVGAYTGGQPDRAGPGTGAVYVFEASGGAWSQRGKLTPADGDRGDLFGTSVAVSSAGTTVLTGAPRAGEMDGRSTGWAYVFAKSGGEWNQQAKLVADDLDGGDRFGTSVALSNTGNTAVVGDIENDYTEGENTGSAYVFDSDGPWSQRATVTAEDGDTGDDFGISVAASRDGTTALVGAYNDEDPNGPGAGSAYVFGL